MALENPLYIVVFLGGILTTKGIFSSLPCLMTPGWVFPIDPFPEVGYDFPHHSHHIYKKVMFDLVLKVCIYIYIYESRYRQIYTYMYIYVYIYMYVYK